MEIGIVGAGRDAVTLVRFLTARGRKVVVLDDKAGGRRQITSIARQTRLSRYAKSAEDITKNCSTIILCLPARSFREMVYELGGTLDGSHVVLHTVQTFEPGTAKRASEILLEETCCLRLGVLGGPLLTGEPKVQPNAVVVGSRFPDVLDAARETLTSMDLKVDVCFDLVGVELANILAPIVSMVTGFARGLKLNPAAMAHVVTRTMGEAATVAEQLGSQPGTIYGLAGLGYVAASSLAAPQPDFQLGCRLAAGEELGEVLKELGRDVKGIDALQELQKSTELKMAFVDLAHDVLAGKSTVSQALANWMELG